MRRALSATVFFLFLMTSPGLPQEPLPSIAILDFSGRNVPSEEAATMTDRFRSELTNTGKFRVMEREQMNLILQEQEFQQTGCVDQSCAVQAGQLIAVTKIVTGTISKVGGLYTANIRFLDVATGQVEQNLSEDCDCPIEAVLIQTLSNLAKRLAGISVDQTPAAVSITKGDAGLFIKTDPAGARVYLDGKLRDNATPLTLENLMAGRHTVEVKKTIDGINYSGKKEVTLTPNRVTRLEVALEKSRTELTLLTVPSEAELYLNKIRGMGTFPDYIAPAIIQDILPGKQRLELFKAGYRDTALDLNIIEFETQSMTITLQEEKDPAQLEAQKRFVRKRSQRRIGKYSFFGSLGLAALGGMVMVLARKDYDNAAATSERLERSSIHTGAVYEDLLRQNRDADDAFQWKRTAAYGLFGAAGAGGILGAVLFF